MFKPPIAERLELAADLVHRTLAGRPAIQQMMAAVFWIFLQRKAKIADCLAERGEFELSVPLLKLADEQRLDDVSDKLKSLGRCVNPESVGNRFQLASALDGASIRAIRTSKEMGYAARSATRTLLALADLRWPEHNARRSSGA